MDILIIEDEILYADQLEMLVDKLGYSVLASLNESSSVLNLLKEKLPDLILMDIHIKGIYDGIELTEKIHANYDIPVIFITSLKDEFTFKRASRTDAVNFIIKPFQELQLQRAIELALRKKILSGEAQKENDFKDALEQSFFVRQNQNLDKVVVTDILYIEADANYSIIHLKDKKYVLKISLAELSRRFSHQNFLMTHRSFLVNQEKIDSVNLQESTLIVGGHTVPLSRRNKAAVLEAINYFRE